MIIITITINLNNKKIDTNIYFISNGVLAGIRTPDRCLRRALLYPAELPGQVSTNKVNYTPLDLFIQALLSFFLQFLHYLPLK